MPQSRKLNPHQVALAGLNGKPSRLIVPTPTTKEPEETKAASGETKTSAAKTSIPGTGGGSEGMEPKVWKKACAEGGRKARSSQPCDGPGTGGAAGPEVV